MKQKKKGNLFLAGLLTCSLLVGCSNKQTSGTSTSSGNLTDRYNSYVELYNEMVAGAIQSHIEWYFDDIADQEEFQSKEGKYPDDSSFSEYDYKDLETAYGYAQTKSEYTEVDESVATLYPTLKELMEKLDEAFAYGASKGYLDDDFAKAKELHAIIYPLLDTYYTQGNDFVEKFDALAISENEKEREELKANGYELRYTMSKILDIAELLSGEFYKQENVYSENINELDLTNIQPLYDELTTLVTNCSSYVKDEEQIKKEGFDPTFDDMYLERFAESAVNLKACMAVMIQRVKDNNPPTESDMLITSADDGTFEAFDSVYSGLVDNYNNAIG